MNSRRATLVWWMSALAAVLFLSAATVHLMSPQTSEPGPVVSETLADGHHPTLHALAEPGGAERRGLEESGTGNIQPQTRDEIPMSPSTSQEVLITSEQVVEPSSPLLVAYADARTAPLEALARAVELPPGKERNDLISHIAAQWAAQSPTSAAQWAVHIGEPDLREQISPGIAAAWAETDPRAAAAWALDSIPAGKPQADALIAVVQRWAQQQPEQAATWVAEFPAGALQNTASEELVKIWSGHDLDTVAKWLNTLPSSSARDAATGAYVNKLALSFPESAALWAKTIQDDSLRVRELESVGKLWMGIDPIPARQWIIQAALPEQAKSRLLALKGD